MNCFKCQKPISKNELSLYGLHSGCFTDWFKIEAPAEFISLQIRSTSSSEHSSNQLQNSSFYHGKFKKYSASLSSESYILKMRQEDAPELPEVEYLCNQIGQQLGIPVADFFYIDINGEKTFVTKNFIQAGAPTDLQHLYHFRKDDHHSCEGIIKAIEKQTKRPADISIFLKTVLFDSLIGNHDRHGRNLGFIVTAKGSILSPIYDNVSFLSLEKGEMLKADFNPTGKINTLKTFEPSMKDYVKELIRLGYQEEVQHFYKKINISILTELINLNFCSNNMKSALKKLIEKRYQELKDELSH